VGIYGAVLVIESLEYGSVIIATWRLPSIFVVLIQPKPM
jgi:hypothetical protein